MIWLLLLVGSGCFGIWMASVRRARRAWLKRLNLPGRWLGGRVTLTFFGSLDSGEYQLAEPGRQEQGVWRLAGDQLLLLAAGDNASRRYRLRLFDAGKIEFRGDGLPHARFSREADNIVYLRNRR